MASFNPMSYLSPTSVFSFLPSYLTAAVPQPPAQSSEPKLEATESEESGESLRTEEVSVYSADIQAEDKVSKELNNQQSEVLTNIILMMIMIMIMIDPNCSRG